MSGASKLFLFSGAQAQGICVTFTEPSTHSRNQQKKRGDDLFSEEESEGEADGGAQEEEEDSSEEIEMSDSSEVRERACMMCSYCLFIFGGLVLSLCVSLTDSFARLPLHVCRNRRRAARRRRTRRGGA